MKKLIVVILALALMLAASAAAFAQDDDRTLRVSGSATLSLAADSASLYIGANTTGESVVKAQQENSATMEKVLKAILDAGIAKQDVITNGYDVSVINNDYGPGGMEGKTGYYVSSVLYVTVKDLGVLAKVVDMAAQAGANSIYGLQFSNTHNEEANARAMQLAVEQAKRNAEVLAAAAGKKLGDVISMDDGGVFRGQYAASNSMDMMKQEDLGAAIVTGDVSLTASVSITFELLKGPLMP